MNTSTSKLRTLLGGMATRLKVSVQNPAKGISQKELETILAKATPAMRAQIESQMGAPSDGRRQTAGGRKPRRAKETWAQRMADRIGARLSKTRLRQALNPKSEVEKNAGKGTRAPKKNLFGLDRESRIKRKKKRARVLSAKAGVLEAKEALKRARSNPTQMVTPSLAKKWLRTAHVRSSKDMVPARVGAIAKLMKAGTYKAETPLLFKKEELIDGRHRLAAVVRSGKSIEFPVERVAPLKSARRNGALDAGWKLAATLGGIETAQKLLGGGKKTKGPGRRPVGTRYYLFVGPDRRGNHVNTKPEAVAAARSLANATGGAVTIRKLKGTGTVAVKTVRPQVAKRQNAGGRRQAAGGTKKKNAGKDAHAPRRNGPGEIFEDFTGSPSRKVTTGYVAADAPKEVDLLGPVVQWTIEDPKGQRVTIGSERDGTARTIQGRVVRFDKDAVKLCAIENGNGKRRFVVTVRAVDREKFLKKYPWANGKDFTFGPVAEVIYRARKPHLYNGDNRTHTFYHILGEDGGRRPTATIKNGCPSLKYGAYEIAREGIRN